MRRVVLGLVAAAMVAFSTDATASTLTKAPSLSAFYAQEAPSGPVSTAAVSLPEYQERYHRGRRLYNTGMVVGIAGTVVFWPSFVGFIAAAFGGNEPIAIVTGLVAIGSAGASIGGVFAANMGAANADAAVANAFGYRPDPLLGVAGVAVFVAGVALVPFTQGLSLVGSAVGGFGLAAVQMARPKRGLRDHGVAWHIAPTTQGVMVGVVL